MTTVILSPKFQVVIPKVIREELHLNAGIKLEIITFDGAMEFIPIRSIKSMRGSLKGMDTTIIREKDRPL
ncbi:AbrB/MazE/SpoVT family DNA-binding domain-containing protein [Candidatus Peregrinibacteria bacterium]|nr:AbrB/MazE/SpoVT family DNA-binding domain-containing protein [Candidatus Peregrinibacteria bacterium]